MRRHHFWIAVIAIGLSACSHLKRSEQSGYRQFQADLPPEDLQLSKQSLQENQVLEDLRLPTDQPLSPADERKFENRLILVRLESRLQTQREKRQYYAIKGLLKDDSERIAFLRQPTTADRERWAQARGIFSREKNRTPEVARWIEKNNVGMGMTQKSVLESWGDPEVVEVSGDPVYGNERWKYTRFVSGNEGYNKETRFIYFESGVVVGWETQ